MADEKIGGLSEEEKKMIADTVGKLRGGDRRRSILDPVDTSSVRCTSVLNGDEHGVLAEDGGEKKEVPADAVAKPKKIRKKATKADKPDLDVASPAPEPAPFVPEPVPMPAPAPPTPAAPKVESKPAPATVPPIEGGSDIFSDDELNGEGGGVVKEEAMDVSEDGDDSPETWEERGTLFTRMVDQYGFVTEECRVLQKTRTDGTKTKTGMGFTLNVGDMEFVRLECGIELPTTKQDIPDAYRTCWKIVERESKHQVKLVKKSKLNKNGETENE